MDRTGANELSTAVSTTGRIAAALVLAALLAGAAWSFSVAAPLAPTEGGDSSAQGESVSGPGIHGADSAEAPAPGPEQIPTVEWHAGPEGPKLQGHSIVFDPVNNLYWLFGGQSPSGLGSIPAVQNNLFRKRPSTSRGPAC